MSKLKDFDVLEVSKQAAFEIPGILFIDDFSNDSNFMFNDWSLPIIRAKKSNSDAKTLVDYLSQKFKKWEASGQDYFLLVAKFDENIKHSFSLKFSKNSNLILMEPVFKNLEVSNQKFELEKTFSNTLFSEIENTFKRVSCFELVFKPNVRSDLNSYSQERIFEEIIIFANLAVTKRI